MMQLQSLRRSFSRSLASNGHNGKETDKKVARAPKALSFLQPFPVMERQRIRIFLKQI